MKTYVCLLGLLVAVGMTTGAQAQPVSASVEPATLAANGVYRTADEFVNGVLTDAFPDNTPGERIWADLPGNGIVVKKPEGSEKFPKTSWGYRKAGKDYRIVNGNAYEVVNRDDVLMYRVVDPDPNTYTYTSFYFFSRYPDSDLFLITKRNLEMVYSDHPSFVTALKTDKTLEDKGGAEAISGGVALYLFRQSDAEPNSTEHKASE